MPIRTKPLELGAPLSPEDYPGSIEHHLPTEQDACAELKRAKVELMYAIAKHRKAWSAMRKHKFVAESRAVWAEGYNPYKLAVADVRWWREEMNAQAAVVTALIHLLQFE
jgi:hypothetical protein